MARGAAARTAAAIAAAVALGTLGSTAAVAAPSDPPFSVDEAALDASLDCPEFAHPDREPVLLVHGTGTRGHEQFDWNWLQVLPPLGFDVCVVTYPDRGLIDQQVSAEYVAHAVMTMHATSGRQVDLMGHSQGASMPRWSVRFWPSARAAIDDYVGIAGPYHGTLVAGQGEFGGGLQPASIHQFRPDSRFVEIVNRGDETPGDIDWTNLVTTFDELVQPPATAFLDEDLDNPRVANLVLQDLCPGRVVEHLGIGTTDRLAFDLAVDAFTHDGPADPARLGLGPECSLPTQIVEGPDQTLSLTDLVFQGVEAGLPDLHLVAEEPPTKGYATAEGQPAPNAAPSVQAPTSPADDSPVPAPAPASAPPADGTPVAAPAAASGGDRSLPATGGGLAGLGLVAVATTGVLHRRSRRAGV